MNTRDLHTNKVDDYCKVITVELITQLIHLLNFQLDYTCAISVETKNFVFFCCSNQIRYISKENNNDLLQKHKMIGHLGRFVLK